MLLLEPDSTQIESLQPGFPLRMALAALSEGDAGVVQVTRRKPDAVAAPDFANADVIVLANVGHLTDDRLLALENRVRSGAGLLLFLGPAVQAPFYNSKLHNPERPADSLLPRPLLQLTQADQTSGELARLTRIDWTHPLLAPLSIRPSATSPECGAGISTASATPRKATPARPSHGSMTPRPRCSNTPAARAAC